MDMYYMDVINTLDDLKAREAKIREDSNLSDAGKSRAFSELNSKKKSTEGDALNKLAADWQQVRRAYTEIKAQREQIAEVSAKKWDYARLNYDRANAQSLIQSARSPQDLQEVYESLKLSGDRHALRAFAETGAVMLGGDKNFSDTTAMVTLRRAMYQDAKQLLETPEVLEHRQAEMKLSDDIAKLYEATSRAADDYYSSSDMFSGPNPFKELTKGVSVNYAVDSSLSTKTIVDLDWD